jgi:hypothetical protein
MLGSVSVWDHVEGSQRWNIEHGLERVVPVDSKGLEEIA